MNQQLKLDDQIPAETEAKTGELMEMLSTNPIAIFTEKKLDVFLTQFEADVKSVEHDITTKKGREAMSSFVFQKIVKTRTTLVKAMDAHTAAMKEQVKEYNSQRDEAADALQRIEDEVRKPLTDFENKEKDRVKAHDDALAALQATLDNLAMSADQAELRQRIETLNAEAREWEEFSEKATALKNRIRDTLNQRLQDRIKADDDAAELARFRQAELDRQQQERDDKIAADAREDARKQADAAHAIELIWEQAHRDNAEHDRQAEATARQEAEERAEQARWDQVYSEAAQENRDHDARIERQKQDDYRRECDEWGAIVNEALQENAAFDARKKAEHDRQAEIDRENDETRKREENKAHARKINGQVLEDLKAAYNDAESPLEDPFQRMVAAIARGAVRNASIKY